MGKKPGRYLTSIEKFKCVEETLNKFIADEKCQSKFTEFMNKMMVDNGSGIYFTKDDLPPQNLEFIAV